MHDGEISTTIRNDDDDDDVCFVLFFLFFCLLCHASLFILMVLSFKPTTGQNEGLLDSLASRNSAF